MVGYRRNRIAAGSYFFTVTLRDRRTRTLVEHIDALRLAITSVKRERPFRIDALVVLPEHLHTVWTLSSGDSDYPGRWRLIKGRFTHALAKSGLALSRNLKGEYDLWQRRYWEHTIRDANDLKRHMDYIHFNPVKHGLVKRVRDWPYSTFHRFERQGLYAANWAGVETETDGCFGE